MRANNIDLGVAGEVQVNFNDYENVWEVTYISDHGDHARFIGYCDSWQDAWGTALWVAKEMRT